MANGVWSSCNRLLLLRLLAFFEACVTGGGEFAFELLNPSSRVDEFQLARVKRMTLVADVDLQLFTGAARRKGVTAAAMDAGLMIFGMDVRLHRFFLANLNLGSLNSNRSVRCWNRPNYLVNVRKT